tara:strand:- start:5707 stop:7422 length:1716 start_codon:yes stop_codon:yes gene_type:complete
MIQFKNIRWKNFLSTGNTFTEISLDKSPATLIVGSNGAGKSTVLDALCFSLFNKPFRKISKSQLINSINDKECRAEIEFSIGSVDWKVVRCIKPSMFEIYKNGKKLDQSSSAMDQQKWFEQNVLKLNFKSFTQIVILGSSTFVPFMQLNSPGRREVVEDILDIKIFSMMHILLKEKMRMYNEEVRELEAKAELVKEKINIQDRFIDDLESQSDDKVAEKDKELLELQRKHDTFRVQIDECFHTIDHLKVLSTDIKPLKSKCTKLKGLSAKISSKRDLTNKHLRFFVNNDQCPTCRQSIEPEFKEKEIQASKEKIDELDGGVSNLKDQILEIEKDIDHSIALQEQVSDKEWQMRKMKDECLHIDDKMEYIRNEIEKIKDNNVDKEKAKRSEFLGQKMVIDEMTSDTKRKRAEHDIVGHLLKDGGVKTRIIKKYLPLMNRTIRSYLQKMDFPINFSLDEEFNEIVKSPVHDNFSYASFSEGEKMRIDLALLFTWREVARIKNSVNTNLLILDEIFDSSLDVSGTDDFMKIIRFAIKDANIFVISHKGDMLQDKFADTVQFEKHKSFSKKVTVE